MQWYYADASRNQVAFDESQAANLVQNRTLNQATLVWNESMPDWKPLGSVKPELFALAAPVSTAPAYSPAPAAMNPYAPPAASGYGGGDGSIQHVATAFLKNSGWIKFAAILGLIGAIPACLILVGIPALLACLALLKSVDYARNAIATGDAGAMAMAVESVGKYFKLMGIFLLIYICVYVLVVIFAVVVPNL